MTKLRKYRKKLIKQFYEQFSYNVIETIHNNILAQKCKYMFYKDHLTTFYLIALDLLNKGFKVKIVTFDKDYYYLKIKW